jgi:hypothetical protein
MNIGNNKLKEDLIIRIDTLEKKFKSPFEIIPFG